MHSMPTPLRAPAETSFGGGPVHRWRQRILACAMARRGLDRARWIPFQRKSLPTRFTRPWQRRSLFRCHQAMQQKPLVFTLTLGSVGVVVALALAVSLWPKESQRSRPDRSGLESGVAARGNQDDSMARAGDVQGRKSNPGKGEGASQEGKAAPGAAPAVTSPIRVEVGTALVRDPETGQMKEMPVTTQILMLRNADGTPQTVDSVGAITADPDGSNVQYTIENLPTAKGPLHRVPSGGTKSTPPPSTTAPPKEKPQSAPSVPKGS